MGKMEIEVKVLDINEEEFVNRLESLGGKFIEECNQYLYVYDLPTIYGRFIDIFVQIKEPETKLKEESAYSKLELLFFELDNLLSNNKKEELRNLIGKDNFSCILKGKNPIELLSKEEVHNYIKQFRNNPKKWIRLRKTNNKTTIAIKHILAPNGTNIQQLLETEIEVPSLSAGKDLLRAMGYVHNSYQEKRRKTYKIEEYEIDIDTWPGIPTYFEVEGKDEDDLEYILGKLGYTMEDTVSCTADEIYEMYGKNMFKERELKF